MEISSPPPRPQATAAQNWILFFCWILPGVALLVGVALAFGLTYPGGGKWDSLWPFILFGPPALTAIGCGIFLALIKITQEEGHNWITPKKVFWKTVSFFFIQISVAPFVAVATALGCGAVTSVFPI